MFQQGYTFRNKFHISYELVRKFGEALENLPLLHHDDEYAKQLGFSGKIVPGSVISALIIKMIASTFGNSTMLRSHRVDFLKPIYPENEVLIELCVKKNIKNLAYNLDTAVFVNKLLHCEGQTTIKLCEYFPNKNAWI